MDENARTPSMALGVRQDTAEKMAKDPTAGLNAALDQLESELAELHEAIGRLEDRIAPVLLGATPSESAGLLNGFEESSATSRARAGARATNQARVRLNELRNRVDI